MENKNMPCLIYARVGGYYSAVQTNWNGGKQAEFKDRLNYALPVITQEAFDDKTIG